MDEMMDGVTCPGKYNGFVSEGKIMSRARNARKVTIQKVVYRRLPVPLRNERMIEVRSRGEITMNRL